MRKELNDHILKHVWT